MIAFVTGGTGFVGGHLCERLRRDGWEVRALVRSRRRSKSLAEAGCRLVRGDLSDRETMKRAMGGADLIVHLAGLTKTPNTSEFVTVNGEGTASVLLAALDAGFSGRFIHTSSQAAVGAAVNGRPRTEDDAPAPVSNYGRSKLLGEQRLRGLGANLNPTILRPGAIYGPREHDIYEQIRAMSNTGLAIIPGKPFDVQLTHVDDVVEAIMRCAATPSTAGRDYMLTDPTVWSTQQLTEIIATSLGRRVRTICVPLPVVRGLAVSNDLISGIRGKSISALTRDKVRELAKAPWLGDSSRLIADTGWAPKWELRSGITTTIEWYRKNGWL